MIASSVHGHPGRLVVVEGPDGSGKTTLAGDLARRLERDGHEVVALREPGGTELGEQVRDIVKHAPYRVGDRAEALLFAAARAQLVDEVIRPALERGKIVLLDRHVDSSVIYQGIGRGLGEGEILSLSRFACAEIKPDLVLVVRVSDEVAGARMGERGTADRIEQEGGEFLRLVRAAYRRIGERNPQAVEIDGERPPQEVSSSAHEQVARILTPLPSSPDRRG
jgi:dTMP kinase